MEYVSESETPHDAEMEEVRWVPVDEAIELLAYKGAQEVVQRGKELLIQNSIF
jgi:NADH pyrophosphatase NudC (nudix superfamily)